MQIKYRKVYGCAAVVLGLMLLGTAGAADLGHIEGGALIGRLASELIGIAACARCAMG